MLLVKKIIDQDLVKVRSSPEESKPLTILAWGDVIDVVGKDEKFYNIKTSYFKKLTDESFKKVTGHGFIKKSTRLKDPDSMNVLKIAFVDVQQGDGTVIETPKGRLILIDGGDNALFARYLAQRFAGYSSSKTPLEIEAMVVTHGDADHFAGLTEIHKSENHPDERKRLFIRPKRIFHNGIVKGPTKRDNKLVPITDIFGKTMVSKDRLYLIELHDDLLNLDNLKMNKYFKEWIEAIRTWQKYGQDNHHPITIKRLQYGDKESFSFLDNENIKVNVIGPFTEDINGKSALPILREPPKATPVKLKDEDLTPKKNYSASHTINGHSIILQLKYGNIRFLFSGDLNQEAEIRLKKLVKQNRIDIRSEIFKAPHHGSADYEPSFLELVAPIASVISSGDESARKEYIHPRATLVGSLGKYSRIDRPLVFVTEMVAFFEMVGTVVTQEIDNRPPKSNLKRFFAFKRAQFGIVHVRTDGRRILVFTHSGRTDMKEAYAFSIEDNGDIISEKVRQ